MPFLVLSFENPANSQWLSSEAVYLSAGKTGLAGAGSHRGPHRETTPQKSKEKLGEVVQA